MRALALLLALVAHVLPGAALALDANKTPPITARQISTTMMSMGGPDGFAPTMSGLGYQFYARRYFTGTATVGVNGSLVIVEGDTATVTGGNFANVLTIQNNSFGGPTVQGGRQAIQAAVQQTAPTSASNANRNYVAIYAGASSTSGDGGTGLTYDVANPANNTAKGAYFGINPLCILKSGATNTLNCAAGEINLAVMAGASTAYKAGLQITKLGAASGVQDAVQGAVIDAALSISDQAGSATWRDGILFGTQNGQYPISSSGYLLRSSGPGVANVAITALGVIQTSNLAGTGNRPLFADPSGILTTTPTAVPASSSSPCSVGQYAADATYHYDCVAANTWKRVAFATGTW